MKTYDTSLVTCPMGLITRHPPSIVFTSHEEESYDFDISSSLIIHSCPSSSIEANKEETKSIDHHDITKAHLELISNHHYEDALMLHLMFALKAMPFELRWIRFEDFYESNGKHIINFRHTKAAKLKRIVLEKSLYQEVQNYHNIIKSNKSIYIKGQRVLTKKIKLKGYFVFKSSTLRP